MRRNVLSSRRVSHTMGISFSIRISCLKLFFFFFLTSSVLISASIFLTRKSAVYGLDVNLTHHCAQTHILCAFAWGLTRKCADVVWLCVITAHLRSVPDENVFISYKKKTFLYDKWLNPYFEYSDFGVQLARWKISLTSYLAWLMNISWARISATAGQLQPNVCFFFLLPGKYCSAPEIYMRAFYAYM